MKKKEHFAKHFKLRKILVAFLELSMFINVYLPYIFNSIKWIGDFNMEKKLLDTI